MKRDIEIWSTAGICRRCWKQRCPHGRTCIGCQIAHCAEVLETCWRSAAGVFQGIIDSFRECWPWITVNLDEVRLQPTPPPGGRVPPSWDYKRK